MLLQIQMCVIDETMNGETNIELLAYSDGKYLWSRREFITMKHME